jgi:hypothetical protein
VQALSFAIESAVLLTVIVAPGGGAAGAMLDTAANAKASSETLLAFMMTPHEVTRRASAARKLRGPVNHRPAGFHEPDN